jgi:hypothetical protein
METIVVGTLIAFTVLLFAATAIVPMAIELTARRSPAALTEDQILSVEHVGFDRPGHRAPTPITTPGGAPFHREAA